jgi:poly(3-hydroxyalkanoate) depolymerase
LTDFHTSEDQTGSWPELGSKPDGIEARQISINGQRLQVAIKHGSGNRPPLLLFNGIGANWELAKPFLQALTTTTAIIFDVPGVGGSPRPLLPYRLSTLAQLAAELVAELGYQEVDVAGVSWGGGLAQQFAYQYPKRCRRLVLAATAPGGTMVPASPSVLWKMATPRRYIDKNYLSRIAPDIYGGAFRKDPSLISPHAAANEWRAQPQLPLSAACYGRLDEPAMAMVVVTMNRCPSSIMRSSAFGIRPARM